MRTCTEAAMARMARAEVKIANAKSQLELAEMEWRAARDTWLSFIAEDARDAKRG